MVSIKFKLPIKDSETITVIAEGQNIEVLEFFKRKSIVFFENGAERIRHANQKLTEDQVREIKKIRREKGWGRTRLAKKFKVGKTTIERILNGETWKDIN